MMLVPSGTVVPAKEAVIELGEIGMGHGVRVIGPDRAQLHWDILDSESQLPEDHQARLVWAFVEGLDLSALFARIEARDEVAERSAADPVNHDLLAEFRRDNGARLDGLPTRSLTGLIAKGLVCRSGCSPTE